MVDGDLLSGSGQKSVNMNKEVSPPTSAAVGQPPELTSGQLSSPDQQPQSTSVDERPDSSSKDIGMMPAPAMTTLKAKNDNRILKQLLSQEDEDDDGDADETMTATTVATTTATTTTASVSSDSTLDDTNVSLEKNEAEPKKMDNALLKVGRMKKEEGERGVEDGEWLGVWEGSE